MKSILTQIFVTLGVIFLMIIIAAGYFFVTDPYNLKPLIFGIMDSQMGNNQAPLSTNSTDTTAPVAEGSAATEFTLSPAQREALISLGVDPALVPTSVSPEQEACFVSVFGAGRVDEIKAGAVPTVIEFVSANKCL